MDTRYQDHLMLQARRSRQQQIDRLLRGEIEKREIPLHEIESRCLIQYQGLCILRLFIDGDIVLEMDTSYTQSEGKLPALAEGKLPALLDIKVKHYE